MTSSKRRDSSLKFAGRVVALFVAAGSLLSVNVHAFNSSLQPEAIEEAYSLGQSSNHEDVKKFLSQYVHDFKYPSDHPVAYVQSVEFQTPYEQIVQKSRQAGARYDKFQAEEAYQANPKRVIVRAVVALRLNYAGPIPSAENFAVAVSQSKLIEPRKATNTVLCDPYSQVPYLSSVNQDCSLYQREIVLEFEARQFTPDRATVSVTLPSERSLETTYDLDQLK